MPVEMTDFLEKQEEIKDLVGTIQSDFTAKGEKTDETIGNMDDALQKMVKDHQELTEKFNAEEKARQELEAIVARGAQVGEDGKKSLSSPEYVKSFNDAIRKKTQGIDLEAHQSEVERIVEFYIPKASAEEKDFIAKTLSVGVNSTGGYFVPIDPLRKITERVFETSPMRQIASVITTANEAVTIGIDDEQPSSGWVCEYEERTSTTTPGLGELEISTHEQWAYPDATQKMIEDAAFNVDNWLEMKIGNRFGRDQNEAFVSGDGNKKPRGWNTLAEWTNNEKYERNALASLISNTASTFDGDDLIDLQSLLLEPYQAGAVWAMHRRIWASTVKLKNTTGDYLINPMLVFQGTQPQLLGAPVVMMGDMASTIADGGFPVAYGNFHEGYTIVDRIGIRIIRDEITRPGFVKFHARQRVGGDVTDFQALKRLKIKAA